MEKKITVAGVLQEGLGIGIKNALSILGAVILWILTIWVPYINVGTTIAINAIPIELSKGKVISPLFIFDAKYRRYMGEYFMLMGLMWIALIPAFIFLVVPGIIISIAWSLSLYLLIDKGLSPTQALVQSNKATYGYKWVIFGVVAIIVIAFYLLSFIFGLFGETIGAIFACIFGLIMTVALLGCYAVIYRDLVIGENCYKEADIDLPIEDIVV